MLKKVRECPYDVPKTLSSALALLLTEVSAPFAAPPAGDMTS